MKEKIKSLFLSKTSIFTASLGLLSNLFLIKDVIVGFAANYRLVLAAIGFLISALFIHLFISDKKEKTPTTDPQNSSETLTGKKPSYIPKILTAVFIFITIMLAGSLYYVNNMDVHYVVLKKYLRKNNAELLMKQTNNSPDFLKSGLSTRCIEMPSGNGYYELILKNGYIIQKKAKRDCLKLKSLNTGFRPYVTNGQNVASFSKKLKYLEYSLFH